MLRLIEEEKMNILESTERKQLYQIKDLEDLEPDMELVTVPKVYCPKTKTLGELQEIWAEYEEEI